MIITLRTMTKTLTFVFLIVASLSANASSGLSYLEKGASYSDMRKTLMDKGWKPMKNESIEQSSLYAQDIYTQGFEEVVDCISMEIDACTFHFYKNKQVLEIKTTTKNLTLESFKTYKKR